MSKITRRLDEPWVEWTEVYATADSGCVVDLPHSADRLDVGLAIHRTLPGDEAGIDLVPGDVTARKAWGRLLSLREQWLHEQQQRCDPALEGADVPDDWWPDEGTPAWAEAKAGTIGAVDEIWVVEW